jgi:ankyrin repeat protein
VQRSLEELQELTCNTRAQAAGDLHAVSALATLSSVNHEDDMGRTPLHLAAAVGQTPTVRELVKRHGANLQQSTSQV